MLPQRQLRAVFSGILPLAMLVFTSQWSDSRAAEPEGQKQSPQQFALLIGVGKYQHLGDSAQLDGCANDVAAMRELLQSRFKFPAASIVTLLDEQATGQAIRRELAALQTKLAALPAGTPVQAVIHFSGHGSQIADQPLGDPERDEEDGFDETLVPYDATAQGGTADIRDDELYKFVEHLGERDLTWLWVVLDCCHSGSGVRGTTKLRQLERGLRRLPEVNSNADAPPIKLRRLPPGVVFLSACRAQEVEPEYQEQDRSYGLLTRFLVQSIMEQPQLSCTNYEMLRQQIVSHYLNTAALVWPPTPQLEGESESLRSVLLAAGAEADLPPHFAISANSDDARSAKLAAGLFHGVTIGSEYEIVAAASTIEKSPRPNALWLRITSVAGATAEGKLFRRAGTMESPATWPQESTQLLGVERSRPHTMGAKFCVQIVDEQGRESLLPAGDERGAVVQRAIVTSSRPGEAAWLTWQEKSRDADLVLRIFAGKCAIFPATGMTRIDDAARAKSNESNFLRGGWGPVSFDDSEAPRKIADLFRRIVRARNLLRLAAAESHQALAKPEIELELVRVELDSNLTVTKSEAWPLPAEGTPRMRAGDRYALRLKNNSATTSYVTVVRISPDMGIEVVLPYQQGLGLVEEQRLLAGQTKLTDPFECDAAPGDRWAIALATKEPNDLWQIAQPDLPKARTSRSPLEAVLIQDLHFRSGSGTRSTSTVGSDSAWTTKLLRWEAN